MQHNDKTVVVMVMGDWHTNIAFAKAIRLRLHP